MFGSKTAVLRQIAYARTVRRVIRITMRRMLDGEWINHIFASSDAEFNKRLDDVIKSLDFSSATRVDSCKTVVNVLCDEVSGLCHALKAVCEASGYGEYYESHISHERFVRLVLSVDTTKTGKLLKIVEDERLTPIDVLRGVGAVLNDESLEERAALSERERRCANAELKSLAADMKTTMQLGFDRTEQKMLECTKEVKAVGAKVDAVDEKVSKLKCRGKRRASDYALEMMMFCISCVETAKSSVVLRSGSKTKLKLEDVFAYNKTKLAEHGVMDFVSFSKIVHAYRQRESRSRIKVVEAKRDAALQRWGYSRVKDALPKRSFWYNMHIQ